MKKLIAEKDFEETETAAPSPTNAQGYFENPEAIFVPLSAGNICHFLIAATPDGFVGGYKFFIRSPRNLVETLPDERAHAWPTRDEAVAVLFLAAWSFFSD